MVGTGPCVVTEGPVSRCAGSLTVTDVRRSDLGGNFALLMRCQVEQPSDELKIVGEYRTPCEGSGVASRST